MPSLRSLHRPAHLGHTNYNQFILLDGRGETVADASLAELAQRLCPSPLADDLIVLQESTSEHARARLRIFGADGREADFCGNGALLAAHRLAEQAQSEGESVDELVLDSRVGPRRAEQVTGADGRPAWRVEVGPERRLPGPTDAPLPAGAELLGLLHVGEPHLVLSAPGTLGGFHVSDPDFEAFCAPLRDAFDIEGGVNVTLLFERDGDYLSIRTYERGNRRQTRSCGTGAAAAAAVVYDATETPRWIVAPGGTHRVVCKEGTWTVAAAAETVASGTFSDGGFHFPLDRLATPNRPDSIPALSDRP